MKKVAIAFGVLFGLILVALIVIPMVVDVDQYRPKLVEAVNEKINGKFALGKLHLSLWGRIQVDAAGLELEDSRGRKIVSVKEAFFHLPYSSILSGSPLLTLRMDAPEVRVVKDTNGKLNVMTLMKESPEEAKSEGAPAKAAGKVEPTKLPGLAANARLGIDLKRALVNYRDETTKAETALRDINLRVKDLSLSRETEIEVSGQFEAKQEEALKVSGPFKVDAKVDPHVADGKLRGLGMDLQADFSDLDIQAGGAFHKKRGVTAKVDGEIDSMDDGMKIEKFTAKFFNAEITVQGLIKALSSEAPEVDVSVVSNDIDLKPWNELVPMLKDYDLSGKAKLSAFARGPSAKLQYGADLGIENLKAKSPMLKAQPVVNAEIKVTTDKIEKILATMTAPGTDLTLTGSMVSFTQPKVDLKLASNSLDLDQLIDLPENPKESKKTAGGGKAEGGKSGEAENLDKMLDPLRKNEIMNAMTMVAQANLKLIKYYDVRVTETQAKMSMKNLTASIDSFSTRVFDGVIGAKAAVALKPATPTYQFSTSVNGFDLQKAVSSKLELFKNTLLGKVNLKMEGGGASFNPEPAKKNLNAKGSFNVVNGKFATIDIAKIAGEAINKGLDKVGDKLPGMKGKTVRLPEKESRYETMAADFTIANGVFQMPNFVAKAEKNSGLDLRGSTTVGLIDQELKADWEIIDTYNLTRARDVSVDVSGVKVDSVLAEGNNPVVLPVSIGCKYTAPCPSYGRVPEHFAKVALNNAKKGATSTIKREGQEKAKEAGKKLLKGIFK